MPLAALIDVYFVVIVTVVRVVSWFPYRPVRLAVARILGGLAYRLSLDKRAATERAVAMAFGDRLAGSELAQIVKGSLCDFWLQTLGSIPNRIDARATGDARVIGWERLERALAAGKGVILWESGGFGQRFWAKQILHRKGVRVHQIHGSNHVGSLDIDSATATWARRSLIRPFFDQAQRPYVAQQILLPSSGDLAYARTLLRRLQENAVLCVAADGRSGAKLLAVPFLGARYHFSTGMVSLARTSGATLLPIVCRETEDGKACLVVEEAMRVSGDGDGDRERQARRIVLRYAELIERYIRREPARFRNWHVVTRGRVSVPKRDSEPP